MGRRWKVWWVGPVSLAVFLLAAPAPWALSKRELERRDSRGGVTVVATYLNPLGGVRGDTLDFEVVLDTHSVDLDVYKMEGLSALRDDRGRTLKPLGWFSPKGGGHHRSGVLRFPAKDERGEAIVGPGTRQIELIIRGVAGVPERVLRWELPPGRR